MTVKFRSKLNWKRRVLHIKEVISWKGEVESSEPIAVEPMTTKLVDVGDVSLRFCGFGI